MKSPLYSCISKTSLLKTSTIIIESSSPITLPSCASKKSYIIGEESSLSSLNKAPILEELSLVVEPSSKRSVSSSVSLESSSKSI